MNNYDPYNNNNDSDINFVLYDMPQVPARVETYNDPNSRSNSRNSGKKPHRARNRAIAMMLSCAVIGGASGFGGSLLADSFDKTTILNGTAGQTVAVKQVSSGSEMTAAEVYAANVNATVGISTKSTQTNMFGQQTESAASGSGFIVSDDGYIITNYHVIEDADSATVTTNDGTTYDATLRGYNVANDIAVLKIDADNLQAVTLGSSDKANVGDEVVTIGNPLGELTFSLTSGAISALNREVTMSENSTQKLIQTDAAINSGNSGGALFNMYGQVIGITNAKYSSSGSGEASIDNIGFAIPIDDVKDIITDIIENGTKTNSSQSGNSDSAQNEQSQSNPYGQGGQSQGGQSQGGWGSSRGQSISDFFDEADPFSNF